MKGFSGPSVDEALYMFQRIQHDNFIAALEVFMAEEPFYIILKHIIISLVQIIAFSVYPNELQLAAILGQVSPSRHNIQKCGLTTADI